MSLNPDDIPEDVLREQQHLLSERSWSAPESPKERTKPDETRFPLPDLITPETWLTRAAKNDIRMRLRAVGMIRLADAYLLDRQRTLERLYQSTPANAFEEAWLTMWNLFLPLVAAAESADKANEQRLEDLRNEANRARDQAARLRNEFLRFLEFRNEVARQIREQIREERSEAIAALRQEAKRLQAALVPPPPPPLPRNPCPLNSDIDLDESYPKDVDPKQVITDSIIWAALERRRVVRVSHQSPTGFDFRFDQASTKPPSTLAMDLVEYYTFCPKRLDALFGRLVKLAPAPSEPDEPDDAEESPPQSEPPAPLSQGDAYLKSIGLLEEGQP